MKASKQIQYGWTDGSGFIELQFRPHQMYDYDLGMKQMQKLDNDIIEKVHNEIFADPLSATPFNRIEYMTDILEYAFAELNEVQA